MTKFFTLLGATTALICATPALAQEGTSSFPGKFASTLTMASDYIFRGISQTDEGPAIQGSFDYTYDDVDGDGFPGFYAGVWGSNVDFNDGDEANIEIDLYAGISTNIDMIDSGFKLGGIYYAYPGAEDDLNYDYWEVAASLTHDFDGMFSLTGSYNYSPEFFGDTGDAHFTALSATVPLPYDFTLNGSVGYQAVEDTADYTTWSAGVGYTWNGFALNLAYVDSDLDEPEDVLDGAGAKVLFTVSRSF